MYKIYCDLDNTLVSFEEGFRKISGGISCVDYETKYGTSGFWKIINKAGEDFWHNLKWIPESIPFWNYIKKYNPIILTAPSTHPSSFKGKNMWMNSNLSEYKMVLCSRKDKHKYSNFNNILIDDNKTTVEEWNNCGGIGILFINGNQAISDLKKLGL